MTHSDSELRQLASKLGATRARLLVKMKSKSITTEERLQLLTTTLDSADIKLSQGQSASAEEVFNSAVALASAFAAEGVSCFPFFSRLYLARFFSRKFLLSSRG